MKGGEPRQIDSSPTSMLPTEKRSIPSLRRAALYALRGAVCSLVPVPFLDDHLMVRTHRRLVRELAKGYALELSAEQAAVLAGVHPGRGLGCFLGSALTLLVRFPLELIRRLFRSLVFFLAVRDAINAASRLFHESFLLELALASGAHPGGGLGGSVCEPRSVRAAIDRTLLQIDPRPIEQALAKGLSDSWRLLRSGARRLGRLVRRAGPDAAEGAPVLEEASVPPGLLERLTTALSHEGAYLSALAERLRRNLDVGATELAGNGLADERRR